MLSQFANLLTFYLPYLIMSTEEPVVEKEVFAGAIGIDLGYVY